MSKLIPKHQAPSEPLILQNDNTQVVQPVLPIPATNIDWITVANNKIDRLIQEQPHSEIVRHPKRPKTEEEAMTTMFDPRKAPQTSTTQVIGVSPVDPVGEFVVGNAVLGKPLQWLGKGIMYGAGRYMPSTKFGNWSRAKIISSNMKVNPYRFNRGYYTIGHDWDPMAFYHYERNILPKTLGGTRLHPIPSKMGESKIWLSKGKPWLEGDKTIYKIPVDKVKTQSSKIIDPRHAEYHVADEIDLLQDGVEISSPIYIPDKGGFLTIHGNQKFYVPTTKTTPKTVTFEPKNSN